MAGRVQDKIVIVSGAGQTQGETVGNGRAAALLYAREGARVLAADRDVGAAQATVDAITDEGGEAVAWQADVTDEAAVAGMVEGCRDRWGRIDILHNNVGISLAGGDAVITEIDPAAFDRVTRVNVLSMVLTCKHVIPIMAAQGGGAIVNIGSLASIIDYPYIAYRTSKAGVVALTQNVAIRHAPQGIRANTILPGLMDTPMAIESRVSDEVTHDDIRSQRNAKVPLGGRMGTGWDVAHAALFLASDEAGFITGATLTVDGGQSLVVG